ncbi:HCL531Wp [Eremothecium sinecaudum]|uniref:rRNA methyltransferase 1, mitochondrial n=1 Tax=Eremothecium sinecaudum TaxID=45286 RepID=A0A120K1P8_9SACH|nr:HCL531Wp [Eremothecium sinecaudum]AMD19620.1 HCL531Wp [Eremothecium sinecaudum]
MLYGQFLRCFSRKVKAAVKVPNSKDFTNRPRSFDRNFPVHERKKAWERDGVQKDEWFRKKYAGVHAKQLAKEKADPYGKRASHIEKIRNEEHRNRLQYLQHKAQYAKKDAYQGLKANPLMEYLYGTNSVLAALTANKREYFSRLLYHGSLNHEIASLAKDLEIKIEETDKHRLNLLTDYGVHNNVTLECKPLQKMEISHLGACNPELGEFEYTEVFFGDQQPKPRKFLQTATKEYPLGIYLDEVVDPHNIGSIIRSAYYLGADFVVLSRKNCAPLSPVVSKVSSGAMEVLDVYTTDKPLQFIEKSKSEGGWTFVSSCLTKDIDGSSKLSKVELQDLNTMVQKSPVILVVGNEGNGIRTNIINRSDFFVQVPFGRGDKATHVDSLNVGVATAILLQNLLT